MKLSRTDLAALSAVVVSGMTGLALFGPHTWGDDSITVDVTTDLSAEWTTESAVSVDGDAELIVRKKKVVRRDGTEEVIVTVETDGDESIERRIRVEASADGTVRIDESGDRSLEWVGEDGGEEHVVVRRMEAEGENVFVVRSSDGAEPIVYIDGELVERSAMEELSPDRIDRVEVLKGEAAEKLYGPDAANGVIQIFTKEGAGS